VFNGVLKSSFNLPAISYLKLSLYVLLSSTYFSQLLLGFWETFNIFR